MFVLLALGSRGDVQPMATLARSLADRSHAVTVIALAEYEPLVASLAPAARFVPVAARLDDALARSWARDALTRSLGGQYLLLRRWVSDMAVGVADALTRVVQPCDTIVTGVLGRGAAVACAAGTGCSMATVVFTGQVPTLQPESFMVSQYFTGWRRCDAWGARFSWELSTSLGAALTERVRGSLSLPRRGFRTITRLADRHPIVLAASPLLVPPADDWPATTTQTGYVAGPWQPYLPPAELASFLDRQPVFVGFGSFTTFMTERDLAAITTAARLAERPLLTPTPPGRSPGAISDDVFAVGPVPFDWLFGRVAATIHHGGAGTSHEALRSGRPTAVVPFGVDQPFHGARLHALGLGPAPGRLRRNHLDADDLGRLVDDLAVGPRAAGYARRAAEVAELARTEDGLGLTVDALTSAATEARSELPPQFLGSGTLFPGLLPPVSGTRRKEAQLGQVAEVRGSQAGRPPRGRWSLPGAREVGDVSLIGLCEEVGPRVLRGSLVEDPGDGNELQQPGSSQLKGYCK